ncbi:MAG: biopolymer transporter ExbD [Thermoguttaceae bacterium]|nr:biopolymer transporter ExbD [Thermoguttaceae bacterium]MBR6437070.1 biopolymer transporter ExbD [Thermoguttaceae bacterium]
MAKPRPQETADADMTPMIDMTFQLIAFFMVLINFTEADQNQAINLPSSELAKTPDFPPEGPVTLQVEKNGNVIFGIQTAKDFELKELEGMLKVEKNQRLLMGKDPKMSTIIIRGDKNAKTGRIQQVVGVAQNVGFEKFILRAKEVAAK